MIQKIKISILSFFALFIFSVPLVVTGGVAMAAPAVTPATPQSVQTCLNQGSSLVLPDGTVACKNPSDTPGSSLTDFIAKALNVLSIVVGAIAVVMIIIGGFRYVTSGGKEEGVKGAKNSILYALIGLVIVALAQIIVRFVLTRTAV